MADRPPDARYFDSPGAFRDWLGEHHGDTDELWVGFHRVATGRPSLTWREAVDEALCYGWIDGVRRRVDDLRHAIRFTPRRPGSTWSAVNIDRVTALEAEGRMREPGRAAFAGRDEARSRTYSYEQRAASLPDGMLERLRADAEAWAFWERQPKGYRRTVSWWVISAKREDTRERRFAQLLDDTRTGRRIRQLT